MEEVTGKKIVYIRDEDILERPRICMYLDNTKTWRVGVLIRTRSDLNFIYVVQPLASTSFGKYINDATKEFERIVLKMKRFQDPDMDRIFEKVKTDDYGKSKRYFVYPQPDIWPLAYTNGEHTVYPKIKESQPWKDKDVNDLATMAKSLHYEDIKQWWEQEEKYHYFSKEDADLMTTDIERPVFQHGYSILEPTMYDLTGRNE